MPLLNINAISPRGGLSPHPVANLHITEQALTEARGWDSGLTPCLIARCEAELAAEAPSAAQHASEDLSPRPPPPHPQKRELIVALCASSVRAGCGGRCSLLTLKREVDRFFNMLKFSRSF